MLPMRFRLLPIAMLALVLPLCGRALEPAAIAAPQTAAFETAADAQAVPIVRHYGKRDGLPLNGVSAIAQTRDGYLWLGTWGGLARFDGLAFTRFGTSPRETGSAAPQPGPPSDRILALHEDRRQRLWIGTEDAGVAVRINGQFQSLDLCAQTCQVNAILATENRLWMGTDAGLLQIDPDRLHGQLITGPQPEPYHVSALARDDRDRLFMIADRRLAQFDAGRIRLLAPPPQVQEIAALLRWDQGLLVGSNDLFHYLPEEDRWQPWGLGPVLMLKQTLDGRRFASMRDGRLLQLHADGSHRVIRPAGDIQILSLESDDQNNLWLGTESHGLLQLREPWITRPSPAQLGSAAAGRAIIADPGGGLWMALNCAGLRHWQADGQVRALPGQAHLDTECINSLHLHPDGSLWGGGNTGNLLRLRPDQQALEKVLQLERKQPILALHATSDTELLLGTHRGVWRVRLDARGDVLSHHSIPELDNLTVRQIRPARAGGLWFVGNHGALRMDAGQVLERWGPQQGLPNRFARALHEDQDGTLWIGTYGGGLSRIADGAITHFGPANGLSEDAVSCILESAPGRLWLGGNNGVTLLLTDAIHAPLSSLLFDDADGLHPAEINGGAQNACAVDATGRLWFALVRGFAMLDPARNLAPSTPPPRTYVESVLVDGQPQPADAPLKLGVNSHNVEINYTAIDLTSPEHLRFRFRLSGVNQDWIETGSQRNVLYPSIPWGQHVFEVQARIEGRPWPSTSARLNIHRPAPWYQSPWILLLGSAAALLLLLDTTWQRRSSRKIPDPDSRSNHPA